MVQTGRKEIIEIQIFEFRSAPNATMWEPQRRFLSLFRLLTFALDVCLQASDSGLSIRLGGVGRWCENLESGEVSRDGVRTKP